ncbi:hemagglutinin protein [Aspergillus bombycis]|uniref:Hemagglutinin protein n=1 Tax=Aspergillus bombycis TaxID=109264 RepID=A0A1F7ZUT5_9EURO|nr:hemagglutinin protein [Aspergillus bombycis]OGM43211.1 hemagglutinin protein [Aspergillus bombycis]
MATRQELLSANPSEFRVTSLPRPSVFDISSTEPQQSYSRPSFTQDNMTSYDEEPSSVYGSQPATYGVSTTLPHGALGGYYEVAWSKTCHSDLNVAREGLLPDHEADGTFHHPNYAYMMSVPGTQSTDTTFMPSMVALSSEEQGADRTLPTPGGRNQLQLDLSALPTSSGTISGIPQQDCRAGHPWAPKAIITANNARSMKQSTPEPFNNSPLNRAKQPPSNTQEMVLGYLPMTSASASSSSMPSCGTFTRLNSANSGEELQINEEVPMRHPILTKSARISLMDDSSNIYGYCSSERRKGPKPGTSGMLMNGLPYTRPPEQLQSTPSLTFSLPVADGLSGPGTTTEAHRTQALSNPGGFYSEAC